MQCNRRSPNCCSGPLGRASQLLSCHWASFSQVWDEVEVVA